MGQMTQPTVSKHSKK